MAMPAWIWMGLLAAYSRAPWLTAALIFFIYLAVAVRRSATRSLKALCILGLAAGVVLVSPFGERVIDNLPFVGTIDADTVAYRERLAERSWELIQQRPFFGNPLFVTYLEDLRQGQGIIDLMNTYAAIAMQYGLIGLCLFLGPFLVGMWNVHRLARNSTRSDEDLSLLGFNLIGCMLGTLFFMATGSFGTSLEKMFYVLAGLAAGYARLGDVRAGGAAAPIPTQRQDPRTAPSAARRRARTSDA
jgi:O-antigen ligase